MDKTKTYALGAIIGTVCLLMAAVVLLPAFGFPIDAGMVGTISTAFIGMAGTAGGWLVRGGVNQEQVQSAVAQAMGTQFGTRGTFVPHPPPPERVK